MLVSTTVVSTRSFRPRTTLRCRARLTRRSSIAFSTSGPKAWATRISVVSSGTASQPMRQKAR